MGDSIRNYTLEIIFGIIAICIPFAIASFYLTDFLNNFRLLVNGTETECQIIDFKWSHNECDERNRCGTFHAVTYTYKLPNKNKTYKNSIIVGEAEAENLPTENLPSQWSVIFLPDAPNVSKLAKTGIQSIFELFVNINTFLFAFISFLLIKFGYFATVSGWKGITGNPNNPIKSVVATLLEVLIIGFGGFLVLNVFNFGQLIKTFASANLGLRDSWSNLITILSLLIFTTTALVLLSFVRKALKKWTVKTNSEENKSDNHP